MNLGPSLMKKKARIRTKPSVTNNELAVLTPLKTPEAMAVPLSCTLVMTAWTALSIWSSFRFSGGPWSQS